MPRVRRRRKDKVVSILQQPFIFITQILSVFKISTKVGLQQSSSDLAQPFIILKNGNSQRESPLLSPSLSPSHHLIIKTFSFAAA